VGHSNDSIYVVDWMKLIGNQRDVFVHVMSILSWSAPGEDTIRMKHRKDGKFQISWNYSKELNNGNLETVVTEQSTILVSRDEMASMLLMVADALQEKYKVEL
jgi:hypothetical protein